MDDITRAYSCIVDSDMLEESQTYLDIFVSSDEADFVAFDSAEFGGTFKADWQAAINAARATLPDEQVIDQQQQLTKAVDEKMAASRNHFQEFKYWIEKAFPQKKYVWHEFGYASYKTASTDPIKMIVFMDSLHYIATKYSTELIATGYSQQQIDALQTAYNNLRVAQRDQSNFIRQRKGKTYERIEKHNAVWAYMTIVCRVGKFIYKTNPAKYNHYILPAGGSNEQPEIFDITGRVTDTNGAPLAGATLTFEGAQHYQTTTDRQGKYGQAAMEEGPYKITVTLAGKATQTRNVNLLSGTTLQMDFVLTDT